jgi:hypothetical protein
VSIPATLPLSLMFFVAIPLLKRAERETETGPSGCD